MGGGWGSGILSEGAINSANRQVARTGESRKFRQRRRGGLQPWSSLRSEDAKKRVLHSGSSGVPNSKVKVEGKPKRFVSSVPSENKQKDYQTRAR